MGRKACIESLRECSRSNVKVALDKDEIDGAELSEDAKAEKSREVGKCLGLYAEKEDKVLVALKSARKSRKESKIQR